MGDFSETVVAVLIKKNEEYCGETTGGNGEDNGKEEILVNVNRRTKNRT